MRRPEQSDKGLQESFAFRESLQISSLFVLPVSLTQKKIIGRIQIRTGTRFNEEEKPHGVFCIQVVFGSFVSHRVNAAKLRECVFQDGTYQLVALKRFTQNFTDADICAILSQRFSDTGRQGHHFYI